MGATKGTPVGMIFPTANTAFAGLLSFLKIGNLPSGYETVVSYSFPYINGEAIFSGLDGKGDYSRLNEHTKGFALNAEQMGAVRNAFSLWSDVANITFEEVSESESEVGTIRLAWTDVSYENALAWAYYPSVYPTGSDIWFAHGAINHNKADIYTDSWDVGSSNFRTTLHEIGHALGLSHPWEGYRPMSETYDNWNYTVMSYSPGAYSYRLYPESPMISDIAAIQHMYGANMSHNAGDNIYTFDSETPFLKTIWDAGGDDTIDISNFNNGSIINLNEGTISKIYLDKGESILGIAYGVDIENVRGSAGDDRVIGSGNGNHFFGGDGIDTFEIKGNQDDYIFVDISSDLVDTFVIQDQNSLNLLSSVERVVFDDYALAFDVDGRAGQVNRLVDAVLETPDMAKTGYWLKTYDSGAAIEDIANRLLKQADVMDRFDVDDSGLFVNNLYANVLGRAADNNGLEFWVEELESGRASQAEVLLGFTESQENIELVGISPITYVEFDGIVWV